MTKKYDYLIVGAGLYGCVFAHEATKAGKRCLVIDKRSHLGGNVHCKSIENINVHTYGAHIFHTYNKTVWNYVNQLVEFNRYTNSPIAHYRGELYNLPFNMNTFYQLWKVQTPTQAKDKIEEQRAEMAGRTPNNLEEQAISLVGRDIYEKLIKGYTEKQWGRKCTELPAFIIKRLPVRFVFDNNYFNDPYQGIPIGGYNSLIEKLLKGCDTKIDTDFFENRSQYKTMAEKIIFTGRIDEFFDFCLGELEYRTIRLETEVLNQESFQGNAVVNYTEAEVPYTRIIEHKYFEFGCQPHTVISREYSSEWSAGSEPFYPVNDDRNNHLYEQYKALSKKEKSTVFGGRLAEYKYYDMDKVIERALEDAQQQLKSQF